MWRRLVGRNHPFITSAHGLNARRPPNDHGLANGRPEMFDAWMGERASDGLKWGESMVSATVSLVGRSGVEGAHRPYGAIVPLFRLFIICTPLFRSLSP